MCETTATIEELTRRMQAAKLQAEVAKRRWNLYEISEAEKNAAETAFAQAFDAYHRARFGNRKPPAIRKLIR